MDELKSRFTLAWLKAASARALHTFIQVIMAMLIVGKSIFKQDWVTILGVGLTSALISYGKSFILGIPELNQKRLYCDTEINIFEECEDEDIDC